MGGGESVPVTLTADDAHDAVVTPLPEGGWEVRTTGGDPYVFSLPLDPPPDPLRHIVLAFEVFCPAGTDSFQVFFAPGISEGRSVKGVGLGVSEGWTTHTVDLGACPEYRAPVQQLRLDFGNQPGKTVQLRHIQLRTPTARERELVQRREQRRAAEARLDEDLGRYLGAEYPCTLTRIEVGREEIRIALEPGPETLRGAFLCEAPLWQNVTDAGSFADTIALADGGARVVVPRYRAEDGRLHDRLLSKWVLARPTDSGWRLLSHARYADDDGIEARADLPVPRPPTRKGIGGFGVDRHDHGSDADALGIGYVTVNVVLSFMQPGPGPQNMPFEYCGRTYHVHQPTIERYDRTLRFCAERGIVVSAILLIPKASGFGGGLGRIFMHPDCDPKGIYSMANVTGPEGLEYYAAALNFLAERYSRPDGACGRIHHWIVHNEVDAGWVWTNAGPKSLRLYMDLYHKSMRAVHLIARSFDSHAKAFASLTHHWTWAYDPKFFGSKEVLQELARFSTAEGDFDWGIAYHPYPESLRNPRCWEDRKVDFTFDTPLITFKNIEVLAAWVELPAMRYRGRVRRTVHLSEQGPNSPDYGEDSLRDQAACMAYAWQKLRGLDAIEAFQYHNWIDNRGEGGLRIGLRKFPGEEFGAAPKPIWFLYQKLDTPEEDEACAFAKKVIGIRDWAEVRHRGEIR
ncbi:MAG: hypothetical protein JXR77_06920 [Lentisphaeria bacterium]|nr:hypothetical protein [Lentisphaeria bacterium]